MSIRNNEIEVRVRVRCAWKRTPCNATTETWAGAYPLSRESEAFALAVPAPEGWRDTDDGIMCPEHAAGQNLNRPLRFRRDEHGNLVENTEPGFTFAKKPPT